MAKRRKRPRRASRSLQNATELTDLDFDILVYLHYSTGHKWKREHLDKAQLIEIIVGHLQRSKNRNITQSFVCRRLEFFCRTWSNQYFDIYKQGLDALTTLDENVKEKIREECAAHEQFKIQERVQTSARILRSRSVGDQSFAGNHVSLDGETESISSARKKRNIRGFDRETKSPLVPSPAVDHSSKILKTSQSPTLSCVRESSDVDITPVPFHIAETQDSSLSSLRPTPQPDHSRRSLSQSFLSVDVKSKVGPGPAEKSGNLPNNEDERSAWSEVPYLNAQHGFETLIQQNKSTSIADQLIVLRNLVNAQVNIYEHELRERKTLCDEKDEEIGLLHDSMASFKKIMSSQDTQAEAMKQISDLQREVYSLENTLDKNQAFSKITTNTNRMKPDADDEPRLAKIAELAKMLRLETQVLFCESKPQARHEISNWRNDHTLIRLMSCCLGTANLEEIRGWIARLFKPGVTGRLFLRSLLSVALCQWVFQSEIPDLVAQRTPLLTTYQTVIGDHLGTEVLHKLDLVAHQNLIQSSVFRDDAVHRRAEALARGFLAKISKLCTCSCKQCQSILSKVWYHELQSLSSIFEYALDLKLEAALSNYDLQAVHYGPGEKLHSYWMERELSSYGAGKPHLGQQQAIKLCLFPALALRPKEGSLVDPYSLISASTDLSMNKERRIVQARVVFGEEQVQRSVVSDSEDEEVSSSIRMTVEG